MIQRDLGDGTYASYDEEVYPPVKETRVQRARRRRAIEGMDTDLWHEFGAYHNRNHSLFARRVKALIDQSAWKAEHE